jgi:hypothetical protein
VLEQVGWAGSVMVNKNSGTIVDGHLRTVLAMRAGEPVPVDYVDLTEDEERLMLAMYDTITGMAATDLDKAAELVASINSVQSDAVRDVLQEMQDRIEHVQDLQAGMSSAEERGEERHAGNVWLLREDVIFPTDHPYGIPDYREDMLSDQIPDTVYDGQMLVDRPEKTLFTYGAGNGIPDGSNPEKGTAVGGVLCFYIDDPNFANVWNDAVNIAAKFKDFGWGSLVAPDFSMFGDDPKAVSLWALYRSRWCARYWQEVGMKVIPTIMLGPAESREWLIHGIPKKLPLISCQVRTMRLARNREKERLQDDFKTIIGELQPENVLLYGGKENKDWVGAYLPHGPKYHYLSSFMAGRAKHRAESSKRKKQML